MASQMSVGFVGAGQMATALVRGFLAAGIGPTSTYNTLIIM